MVPAEVLVRLVRFSGERRRPGSAFIVEDQGVQYLITARHLCIDEPEEQIELRHAYTNNGLPIPVVLARKGVRDGPEDVAAFVLPASVISIPNMVVPLDSDGVVYSQECFILGYPYELSTPLGPGSTQHLPIIKRGIIAGSTEANGIRTWYVDIIANPGFSGGPLAIRNERLRRWQFVGVVIGNVLAPIAEPTPEVPAPPQVSAGLSIAPDAAAAQALLT